MGGEIVQLISMKLLPTTGLELWGIEYGVYNQTLKLLVITRIVGYWAM